MRRVRSLLDRWGNIIFFGTTLLIVITDQLSKFWIRSNLAVGESFSGVGFFRLTYVRNSGAAFGLFPGQSFMLSIIALAGVATLLLYTFLLQRRLPFLNNRRGKVALGLVLGGAVGNLIDRIYRGSVTDFIDFSFWPAFNIADSAIVIGTIMLAYLLIYSTISKKRPDGHHA